jgi:hypothetical protein
VILTLDPIDFRYVLWNAGNGTAMNVKVSVAVNYPYGYDIDTYSTLTSELTQEQKDVLNSSGSGALMEGTKTEKQRY